MYKHMWYIWIIKNERFFDSNERKLIKMMNISFFLNKFLNLFLIFRVLI